jgi:hypothetical protein
MDKQLAQLDIDFYSIIESDANVQTIEAVSDLQLCLVGGGIGDTVL